MPDQRRESVSLYDLESIKSCQFQHNINLIFVLTLIKESNIFPLGLRPEREALGPLITKTVLAGGLEGVPAPAGGPRRQEVSNPPSEVRPSHRVKRPSLRRE